MSEVVDAALGLWGLDGARYELIAARENAVYRVDLGERSFALRLHRQGYRSDTELHSELLWMRAVADGGIAVPAPVASTTGKLLHHVGGVQVDVLTWLAGDTLQNAMEHRDASQRQSLFHALGCEMARLHKVSDAWKAPSTFERVAWDKEGLLGDTPLWDRFWVNPQLTPAEKSLVEAFRQAAADELDETAQELDYGLIHADLVPGNVMVDGDSISLIDFDDGGFGFRGFELATALLKYTSAPDYPRLKESLLEGYTSERGIDLSQLDLFMALRAATYVGWNITRMSEAGAAERNARFISTACHFADSYLKG